MANFVVKHYYHDGTAVGETTALDLEFGFKLDDAGYINYAIPKNIPLANPKYCHPYYTDWVLFRNGKELMAGIHTPALETTDDPGDTIKVAGLTWLHYLEKRFYPFDPTNPTAYFYAVVARDCFDIIQDIVNTTLAQANSLAGVTFQTFGDPPEINYNIDPGDTGDLLSKIKDLSQLGPFDFEMTWDRIIKLSFPKNGNTVDRLQLPKNLLSVQYTNNGPEGNWMLALGKSATSQFGIVVQDLNSQGSFRRLDMTKTYGDVTDLVNLTTKAQNDLNISAHPVLPLTAIVEMDEFPEFWDTIHCGDIAPVIVDVGYDQIDLDLRVVQITGKQDNEGHETAELSFNLDNVA